MSKKIYEEKFREQLQNALYEETEKPLNGLSTKRIETLIKMMNAYDKDELDLSDYDMFLKKFNSKNNLNLQSCKQKRHRIQGCRHFTFKFGYRFVSAAAILLLVVFTSNLVINAYADNSILNWLLETENTVVFLSNDENYEYSKVNIDNLPSIYNKDFCINYSTFKIIDTLIETSYNDNISRSGIMLPDYIPEGFHLQLNNIKIFEPYYDQVGVLYNDSDNGYICIYTELRYDNSDFIKTNKAFNTVYFETLELDSFTAYIFTGEEVCEAFFCVDGNIYNIRTNQNLNTLYKILENMCYN